MDWHLEMPASSPWIYSLDVNMLHDEVNIYINFIMEHINIQGVNDKYSRSMGIS